MSRFPLVLLALCLTASAALAQVSPSWPRDTIRPRAVPPGIYTGAVIAPTLPSDTLFGQELPPGSAVPRRPIAPTLPGDAIIQPPLWLLDSMRADSARLDSVEVDPLRPDSAGVRPDSVRSDPARPAPVRRPVRAALDRRRD